MTEGSPVRDSHALWQLVRFLVVGGTNTLLTYAIFIGLGLLIEPWIAYTIAFGLGLVLTSIGSSRFVFRSQLALRPILMFAGCYLVIYGIGRLIILLVDPQTFGALLVTSLIVLLTTTPLVFIVGRFVFNRSTPGPVPPETAEDHKQ